ncbi:hypothetical protein HC761_02225 [bacterium]|nr:hypothetical protein [bacterium]
MSDGTTAGTTLLKEINPSLTVGSRPVNLRALGNSLLFTANDGTGSEIWKSDGSNAGTVKVVDLVAGSSGISASQNTAITTQGFLPHCKRSDLSQ